MNGRSPRAAPPPNIVRDKRIVQTMVSIFCADHHRRKSGLCGECEDLLMYALLRLEKCPFQEKKTTCAKCPIHCYKPELRARMKTVMRESGPKMFWRHPLLTLSHFRQEWKGAPPWPLKEKAL
ncbi:MAG: nitrous oxide-stimulated promoter family protein [Elusimicrobia bacterium]|nr:nitrous oxide-stimulated promoter family protein [Elusimicrobiota bacterium]